MMNVGTRHAIAAVLVILGGAASLPVFAQSWPDRPVQIVVPFPPGGSVDVLARLLSSKLSEALKASFVVFNKPGASGSLGLDFVAKSPPDGYTFAMIADSSLINPTMMPNLPYDEQKDLTPVMLIGTAPLAIVTAADQPYKTFSDVVETAKARPGKITYGTTGVGSLGQLAMVLIEQAGKFKTVHVPYRGGGPMVVDVTAKHIDLGIASATTMAPYVQGGKLRCIGLTGDRRVESMPDCPPLSGQGFPTSSAIVPWFLLAPASTPRPVIDKLHTALVKILNQPEVKKQLTEQLDMQLAVSSPEEAGKWLGSEIARWAKVIKDNHIAP